MIATESRSSLPATGRATACLSLSIPISKSTFDLEAIFYRSWLMAGFAAELDRPGFCMASWVGPTPIVVLRNHEGAIVGFHNSCGHRGAQICPTESGRMPKRICPYRQWTYALDGTLTAAQGTSKDFDLSGLGLKPIKV